MHTRGSTQTTTGNQDRRKPAFKGKKAGKGKKAKKGKTRVPPGAKGPLFDAMTAGRP